MSRVRAKALLRWRSADCCLDAAQILGGFIRFRDLDLLALSEAKMEDVRGAQISLLGQDPNQALNPVLRVGDQVTQVVRAHNSLTAKKCRQQAEGDVAARWIRRCSVL